MRAPEAENRRLVIVWAERHMAALQACLRPGDLLFPLTPRISGSVPSEMRDRLAQLPFWSLVATEDLDAADAVADAYLAELRLRLAGRADYDRTSLWHSRRESEFTRVVMRRALGALAPVQVVLPSESDGIAQGIQDACGELGMGLERVPIDIKRLISARSRAPLPPTALRIEASELLKVTRDWVLVLAIGLRDIHSILDNLRRDGRLIVVAMDETYSGDHEPLYALSAQLKTVRIAALWEATSSCFSELGDNSLYARDTEAALRPFFAASPEEVVLSDVRRPDTVACLRLAREHGTPIGFRAHGGAPMHGPYRFSQEERRGAKIEVWTRMAAQNYGGDVQVRAPPRLRPGFVKSAARLALRASKVPIGLRKIGIVVTTDTLHVAPDCDINAVHAVFVDIARKAPETVILILRLRPLEESPSFWRSLAPERRNLRIELTTDRSFAAFARECDLVVELGSESSTFLEAAANAVPYVRIDDPRASATRLQRPAELVPRLPSGSAWSALALLASRPVKRALTALAQFAWLMRETTPISDWDRPKAGAAAKSGDSR